MRMSARKGDQNKPTFNRLATKSFVKKSRKEERTSNSPTGSRMRIVVRR